DHSSIWTAAIAAWASTTSMYWVSSVIRGWNGTVLIESALFPLTVRSYLSPHLGTVVPFRQDLDMRRKVFRCDVGHVPFLGEIVPHRLITVTGGQLRSWDPNFDQLLDHRI